MCLPYSVKGFSVPIIDMYDEMEYPRKTLTKGRACVPVAQLKLGTTITCVLAGKNIYYIYKNQMAASSNTEES